MMTSMSYWLCSSCKFAFPQIKGVDSDTDIIEDGKLEEFVEDHATTYEKAYEKVSLDFTYNSLFWMEITICSMYYLLT